jgi:hypothetical protein
MKKRIATVGAVLMVAGLAAAQPADKKAAPPAPVEMKPADEIAAMFKQSGGKWSCTGKGMDMTGKEVPFTYTITSKMDLGNYWIQSQMASKKTKEMPAFAFTMYTSYDAKTKQWTRLMVDNMGGHEVATSAGLQGQTVSWEGKSGGMGMSAVTKHTDEIKGPKEMVSKGQMSMDAGKTWMPMYEATCKK